MLWRQFWIRTQLHPHVHEKQQPVAWHSSESYQLLSVEINFSESCWLWSSFAACPTANLTEMLLPTVRLESSGPAWISHPKRCGPTIQNSNWQYCMITWGVMSFRCSGIYLGSTTNTCILVCRHASSIGDAWLAQARVAGILGHSKCFILGVVVQDWERQLLGQYCSYKLYILKLRVWSLARFPSCSESGAAHLFWPV